MAHLILMTLMTTLIGFNFHWLQNVAWSHACQYDLNTITTGGPEAIDLSNYNHQTAFSYVGDWKLSEIP